MNDLEKDIEIASCLFRFKGEVIGSPWGIKVHDSVFESLERIIKKARENETISNNQKN